MILQSSYPSCARGIKKRTCWEESDPKQAGSKIKAMEFSASALLINLFASKRSFKLEVYHISFTDHEKKKKNCMAILIKWNLAFAFYQFCSIIAMRNSTWWVTVKARLKSL